MSAEYQRLEAEAQDLKDQIAVKGTTASKETELQVLKLKMDAMRLSGES